MHTWQGSMDGQHWTQLRTHHNDQTLCQAGQYASWPIFGSQALLPFRFFRVILLGPTTSLSAQWNLSLCYLELYGYFRWLVPTSNICALISCLLSILFYNSTSVFIMKDQFRLLKSGEYPMNRIFKGIYKNLKVTASTPEGSEVLL